MDKDELMPQGEKGEVEIEKTPDGYFVVKLKEYMEIYCSSKKDLLSLREEWMKKNEVKKETAKVLREMAEGLEEEVSARLMEYAIMEEASMHREDELIALERVIEEWQ